MKIRGSLSMAVIILSTLAISAGAVDLQTRYKTHLLLGDSNPEHARAWEFNAEDIFQIANFEYSAGNKLKVSTGPADLGIGHCEDGAVWALVIPREPEHSKLTSSAANKPETIAQVWLRFHPAMVHRYFGADAASKTGNTNLVARMRSIADSKMGSSWQSDGKAMIPGPNDATVYVDTTDGAHRFFIVDSKAQTAEYVDAFNKRSARQISANKIPPVVLKTVPEAGSEDVSPGVTEIKVTFSKAMRDGSWSWCDAWDNSTPKGLEKPKYEADGKTCVLKVKLEPNKSYGYWLNTKQFRNFTDESGQAAVPYLLTFKTRDQ